MDILQKVILYTPGLVSYRKVVWQPQSIFLRVWTRTPSLASSFSTSITVLVLLFCLTPGMSEWYLYKLKNTSIFYDPCAFLLISAFHRPLAKLVKSLLLTPSRGDHWSEKDHWSRFNLADLSKTISSCFSCSSIWDEHSCTLI